jgi:hypothetical protein
MMYMPGVTPVLPLLVSAPPTDTRESGIRLGGYETWIESAVPEFAVIIVVKNDRLIMVSVPIIVIRALAAPVAFNVSATALTNSEHVKDVSYIFQYDDATDRTPA